MINGTFKDNTFIPDSVVPQKQAWRDFFDGIRSLDEELPDEFDKIVEKGMTFSI